MHPSGGDVLCYAGLARALDGVADVVALTDPQLAGVVADGPETVPGIAARYLDALRTAGHRGPWLLGGWSMGGTVAQEMAVQAHEAGEQVDLLAMLDSNDPTHIVPVPGVDPAAVELEVALRHLRALEAYLGVDLDTGPAATAAITALSAPDRAAAVAQRLREHRLLGRGEPDATATARLAVFARHLRALAAHTPRRYPDPALHTLLVRADRVAPRNSGIGMGVDDTPPDRLADLGWGTHLAGPLHVVGADTHHYGLLHPPALRAVADALRTALTTALDRAPALPTLQRTP
jgi:thioesterase domain-containing protein